MEEDTRPRGVVNRVIGCDERNEQVRVPDPAGQLFQVPASCPSGDQLPQFLARPTSSAAARAVYHQD